MTDIIAIPFDEFAAMPFSEERFSPCIYDVASLGVMYYDGRMLASVDVEEDAGSRILFISTWDCDFRGKGYSRIALEWLRERFDQIVVLGAGEIDEDGVGDIATSYWQHIESKGLVDVVLLDDGSEMPLEERGAPGISAT